MTTYTTLTDTTLSQDKPFTQSIARAMRDNPKALAEGDVTAPEVVGLSPLDKQVASNSASLVFDNLPDGYDVLEFDIVGIYPVSPNWTNTLVMEVSTDNGSSWVNTGYQLADDSGAVSSSSWALTGTSNTFNTVTANSINGRFRTYNFSSSSLYKQMEGQTIWLSSAPSLVRKRFYGQINDVTKFNAVRFRFSTGNINSGYITMRRVRPS
ncbi:hypothetical protein [Rhizobium leguminosarum]|uniref:hypothetical protein n=1 Tax=Rhizobium leguminosarum TaxID=384 RepID=UPI0003A70192|nr:hypothetical protein [Rhizobium leguminosarum]